MAFRLSHSSLSDADARSVRILRDRFSGMKSRCCNARSPRYADYGGRGIGICAEWLADRDAFVAWALKNGFSPELQIDRIDNDAGYSPDNCRWVTPAVNTRNRRNTIRIGDACLKDACLTNGIPMQTAHDRVRIWGWTPARAALLPVGYRRPHLCFFKGAKGGCTWGTLRGTHNPPCPFSSDAAMRGCLKFHEFASGEDADALQNASVSISTPAARMSPNREADRVRTREAKPSAVSVPASNTGRDRQFTQEAETTRWAHGAGRPLTDTPRAAVAWNRAIPFSSSPANGKDA